MSLTCRQELEKLLDFVEEIELINELQATFSWFMHERYNRLPRWQSESACSELCISLKEACDRYYALRQECTP